MVFTVKARPINDADMIQGSDVATVIVMDNDVGEYSSNISKMVKRALSLKWQIEMAKRCPQGLKRRYTTPLGTAHALISHTLAVVNVVIVSIGYTISVNWASYYVLTLLLASK